ncbi:MAG: hypothetical protein K2X07_11445 [Caulobacteraceae bacterium]|nr:hypothetical protein [Caulobacteraceae bacterium]
MWLALLATAGLTLGACSQPADDAAAEAPAAAESAPKTPMAAGRPAAAKAPAYAVLPQDGTPDGSATVADGPEGPGGMVTYQTALSPDAVVEFHRGHAEAAGLATVMTMTQGEARAYGAAAQDASGAGVQVVASPIAAEGGRPETSVTLTWTAGG